MPSGFGREESLAYSYAGYLEFTHLVGLPHIHVADQFIGFAGAESGGAGERLSAGQHPGRQPA